MDSFDPDCQLNESKRKELLSLNPKTTFSHNDFLPRYWDLIKKRQWKHIGKLFWERWFYTKFENVRIDDADTVMAPDLYRYVKDQQYLSRFKKRTPIFYWFWNITTACGWSATRVLVLSLLAIILFAWFYCHAPFATPDWLASILPDFLFTNQGEKLLDPEIYGARYPSLSNTMKWFFASFDIFTNLGIRSTHPQNDLGVVAVFLETLMGYASLGLLISVMTSKYTRRS